MVMRVPQPPRFCSGCGGAVAFGDAFCAACGTAVRSTLPEDVVLRCPDCGGGLGADRKRADGRFDCPWCGHTVTPREDRNRRPVAQLASAARPAPRDVSGAIAFLCWFILGWAGLHRFYLGQNQYGAIMAGVNIVLTIVTGGAWLIVAVLWWLVELFLLPGAIQKAREGA